jgi:hypothetical protein
MDSFVITLVTDTHAEVGTTALIDHLNLHL